MGPLSKLWYIFQNAASDETDFKRDSTLILTNW